MASAIKDLAHNLADRLPGHSSTAPPQLPSEGPLKELQGKYSKAGQEQVFAFYDKLDTAGKASLYKQLSGFDPDHINKLTKKVLNPAASESKDVSSEIEPLPASALSSVLDSKNEDLKGWYEGGLDLIAENKVGVILMAGGQGTRLGSSAPKGCFDIGLPSKKSLFQLQAERIWKLQQLAQRKHGKAEAVIPWYVMTSGPTRGPTEDFFKENNYFGLKKENVFIFEQGVLPCISNEGKILLESKDKVICSLNSYAAIDSSNHMCYRLQSHQMAMEAFTKPSYPPVQSQT
jgi:UDP-N-acetylglucosamine/UDP-N-acetylgalactosamine diphosphorylase